MFLVKRGEGSERHRTPAGALASVPNLCPSLSLVNGQHHCHPSPSKMLLYMLRNLAVSFRNSFEDIHKKRPDLLKFKNKISVTANQKKPNNNQIMFRVH